MQLGISNNCTLVLIRDIKVVSLCMFGPMGHFILSKGGFHGSTVAWLGTVYGSWNTSEKIIQKDYYLKRNRLVADFSNFTWYSVIQSSGLM